MFFYMLFPFLIAAQTRWLIVIIGAAFIFQHGAATWGDEKLVHFLVYIFPPSRIADFIGGIILYRIYKERTSVSALSATTLQICSVILLVTFFVFKDYVSQAARYDIYYFAPMCFLILSFAWQSGYLARLISSRMLVFLGEASFALYLIHQLGIRYGEILRLKMLKMTGVYSEILFCGLYVTCAILVSVVLFLLFENYAKALTLETLRHWRKQGGVLGTPR
jgi:peptidoglycan/LPS O-acetylase OafA/YrhL